MIVSLCWAATNVKDLLRDKIHDCENDNEKYELCAQFEMSSSLGMLDWSFWALLRVVFVGCAGYENWKTLAVTMSRYGRDYEWASKGAKLHVRFFDLAQDPHPNLLIILRQVNYLGRLMALLISPARLAKPALLKDAVGTRVSEPVAQYDTATKQSTVGSRASFAWNRCHVPSAVAEDSLDSGHIPLVKALQDPVQLK
ncbi:hypothetical protein MKZ38_007932 [Zalerion maritima]|uniref:Uncharacterized protein n=1 Tax=Zalerion maritima TaxID=339359 RepID=A0AAD5WPF5_9PEZI|nr:hypothetical protein MKZ38_007932 [Zalerion maritima]